MTKNFRDTLDECLKGPEFRAEWDALESEFEIAKAAADSQTAKDTVRADIGKPASNSGEPSPLAPSSES